jgi:anti-anti-sigma factor
MSMKERILTLDECRSHTFDLLQLAPFWDGLDYAALTKQGIGHVVLVEVAGALEGTDAQAFLAAIERLVQRGERIVVVDLAHLKRVDSTGLSELVRSVVCIKKASGSMPLVNAPTHFRHLVEKCRFL